MSKAGRPKATIPKRFKHPKSYSTTRDFRHTERLREKALKFQTLNTLLIEHLRQPNPDEEYIRGLRKRRREAEQQLNAMRP